ncbi:hypothetical protein SETIT_4G052200v2 [Setaria italica]|uniref:Uncharacterized protein n=1 Tax=Setaria italica TaxID=4555 RepID=A0A368QQY9_SETIT|nr:hypothetical protein SETIT_4G052200v2 [Setaria italica]
MGRGRQRRGLPWAERGLEQAALFGLQVAVVAAGAAVEQADDDARATAAVGVMPRVDCCFFPSVAPGRLRLAAYLGLARASQFTVPCFSRRIRTNVSRLTCVIWSLGCTSLTAPLYLSLCINSINCFSTNE